MKVFKAATVINATPETIWKFITDGPGYPNWDPGVDRIEGTISAGEKITAYTKLSPDRAFPVKVSVFEPGRKMVWSSGMPLGLFKGERTFLLEPQDDGRVKFSLREEFSGLMLPIIGRTIPDLTSNFENFVTGLKAAAENAG